jgi:phytoene synthase
MDASYAACRSITRHHAKSFYFASHTLPAAKRNHAYAVYAFCRHVDDVIDHAPSSSEIPALVADLENFVQGVFDGSVDETRTPWLPAFRHTVRACDIPALWFQQLLHGVLLDQGRVRIADWPELDKYCYHVAGVVGLMMTRVFGLADRSHEREAVAMGIAMQLTNILRDVAEDLRRDRIYLPASEMAAHGIDEEFLQRGTVSPAWIHFMKFQIGRARDFYQQAEPGIRALPGDGSRLTTRIMSSVYGGILGEIERAGYNVFRGRVHVPLRRKCLLALRCLAS